MKKKIKILRLSRETLMQLDRLQVKAVAGAVTNNNSTCLTCLTCPHQTCITCQPTCIHTACGCTL